ncbi:MAG: two-component regulator propeller domain-containing protein [Saprospiraceae bacterium]
MYKRYTLFNSTHRQFPLKLLFLLVCFLTGFSTIYSQQPFWREHPIHEEFSKAKINLIHEHPNGMIWFGTNQGLFYFDGLKYVNVPFRDSIPSVQNITALGTDPQGRIWAGMEDGNIYIQNGFDPLKIWKPEEGLPKSMITGIKFTSDSTLWFSTYGEGLYCYQQGRMYNFGTEDGLRGMDLYTMEKGQDNTVWVGTDLGINICSFKNETKFIKTLDSSKGLKDEIVRDIKLDHQGNAWIASFEMGVFFYEKEKDTIYQKIPNTGFGEITKLELFKNLELWIGTVNKGIWRTRIDTAVVYPINNNEDLIKANISDLKKDAEGNIWVLNGSNITYSANRQFEWVESSIENVQAVVEDQNGVVWIGTPEGLFFMEKDDKGRSFFKKYWKRKNFNITSLFEDSNGKIWIGTYGDGLYCLTADRRKSHHLTPKNSGLKDGNIFSIAEQNGSIWLASLRGMIEIRNPEFIGFEQLKQTWYSTENGLPTDYIYKVFIDSRGVVWLGTDGKGLVRILNGQIKTYQEINGFNLKTIYSITEDLHGNIWFCSSDNGIFKFDGNDFEQLALPEGIRNLTITSLITDVKGNILVVHSAGIDILDPKLKHLTYYDQEIGVEDIEPNLNAVCRGNNFDIWIGTQQGLINYKAEQEDLEIHPRTLIKSVSVFLQEKDVKEGHSFEPDENYISFDVIGLWYTDPNTVEYRYMLEGYDLNWKKSRDNFINYPHLPPGNYTFKIQSTENGAFDKEPMTTFEFSIQKPFWQQLWFLIVCILIIGGLFYWYQHTRDRRIHRESMMVKEKIESQFETLKSQINPHFLFNSFNTLMTVIDENPEQAMQYVQALSDFYRSIVQYREKDIIPMEEEIEIVKNYGYLLEQRYGENLYLKIDIPKATGYLVPLSLQMLVENAVKHNVISKSKPLSIFIYLDEDKHIVVSNPLQLKLTPEPSTQYGLESIGKRYEYLTSKKMLLEKSETHFIVRLPIIDGDEN